MIHSWDHEALDWKVSLMNVITTPFVYNVNNKVELCMQSCVGPCKDSCISVCLRDDKHMLIVFRDSQEKVKPTQIPCQC